MIRPPPTSPLSPTTPLSPPPAGAMPAGPHVAPPAAPPPPARIPAGGRDLEEVRPISLVEAQGGLGQASRIPIDLGKEPPHGVGDAVHGLVVDGGEHALAPAHGLHVESAP